MKQSPFKISEIEELFTRLLPLLDPNPAREDLKETPRRAAKAWIEWTEGYRLDPFSLIKTFSESAVGYDELVIVNNIPFHSHCAHHLAHIVGHCHVGYLPKRKIVGLSKIPRIVEVFAHRLQTQENLTSQIADCLMVGLDARAVGVIMHAQHGCLSTRGAKIHDAKMTTSSMLGLLRTDADLRAEFLSLCNMKFGE